MPVNALSELPGGGVLAGLQAINNYARNSKENRIKQAELEYKPYNLAAQAASQLAYSQFVGPQSIGNFLSNPATRGYLPPDVQSKLIDAYAKSVQQPNALLANLPVPSPRGDGILDKIVNYFSNSAKPAPQPQPGVVNPLAQGQPMQAQQQQGGAPPANNLLMPNQPAGQEGAINNLQAPNINTNQQPSLQPNPQANIPYLQNAPITYKRLANFFPKDILGAYNSGTLIEGGQKAVVQQMIDEAKNNEETWHKELKEVGDESTALKENEDNIMKLLTSHDQLNRFEKGVPFGKLPGISTNAQDYDRSMNNLIASRLRAWQSQRITNMDIIFGQSLKAPRSLQDQSFKHFVNYEMGLTKRSQEELPFDIAAYNQGLSRAEAKAVYARYANERPFYDFKNNKIIPDNLNAWRDYLTPQSIQETFSPKFKPTLNGYIKNMAGNDPETDQQVMFGTKKQMNKFEQPWPNDKPPINEVALEGRSPPEDNIWMVTPQGMQVPVHKQNENYVTEKYHFRKLNVSPKKKA